MTGQERRWPQTYWEYAGLGTPEMKRRAKEAGCLTDKEVNEWLNYTYGRDQNWCCPPMPYKYLNWPKNKDRDQGKSKSADSS